VMLSEVQTYPSSEIMNISSGVPTSIRELIETVADLCGYQGRLEWDTTKPDGQRHKVYDVTRLGALVPGFTPTPLREGLRRTIEWFQREYASARL